MLSRRLGIHDQDAKILFEINLKSYLKQRPVDIWESLDTYLENVIQSWQNKAKNQNSLHISIT